MRKPLLAVLLFVLASLACSLPAAPASPSIDIPTFTPTASSAYVTLDAQGFDEKHLVSLAELLLSNMTPYSQ